MKIQTITTLSFMILLVVCCCSPSSNPKIEIRQNYDNEIVYKDSIKDIKLEKIIGNSAFVVVDKYLIMIEKGNNSDKLIHLFDKSNFKYVASTGIIGRGPGELIRAGYFCSDFRGENLWVNDDAKSLIWKFSIDSILSNSKYIPTKYVKQNRNILLGRFAFVNDSIAIGKAICPLSASTFEMKMQKFNFNNSELINFGYEHPQASGQKKSNSFFSYSHNNKVYANAYLYSDLITINNFDGSLRCNILGEDDLINKNNLKDYFHAVSFFKNYIIASYVNDFGMLKDGSRPQSNYPSKLLIFDLDGKYIKTINLGNKFSDFIADEENKRIVIYFDSRPEPLGYIDLDL